MAQRGYLLVPESQVEAKAAELRAAARSTPPAVTIRDALEAKDTPP